MAKKVTMRCDEMRHTTLGVIRAPLRVHSVVTHLLLAHAAILYVTRLSNKTAINRTVHAAHAHICDLSRENVAYAEIINSRANVIFTILQKFVEFDILTFLQQQTVSLPEYTFAFI